jgi:hypothetical protein
MRTIKGPNLSDLDLLYCIKKGRLGQKEVMFLILINTSPSHFEHNYEFVD